MNETNGFGQFVRQRREALGLISRALAATLDLIEQVRRAEDLYETGRRDREWFDSRDDDLQGQLATVTAELDSLTHLPDEDAIAARVAEITRLVPAVPLLALSDAALRSTLAALGHVVFDRGVVSIVYAPEYRDCFPRPTRVRAVYRRSFLNVGEWEIVRCS